MSLKFFTLKLSDVMVPAMGRVLRRIASVALDRAESDE